MITLDKDELLNNNQLEGLNAVEIWKILYENLKAMNIQRECLLPFYRMILMEAFIAA